MMALKFRKPADRTPIRARVQPGLSSGQLQQTFCIRQALTCVGLPIFGIQMQGAAKEADCACGFDDVIPLSLQ